MIKLASLGFVLATLPLCFGASSANAFVGGSSLSGANGSLIVPAAMCGRTCRNGGRYIPGPPDVCYQEGLEYCGSSRGGPPPREPGVGIGIPGTGLGIGVGPGGAGVYVAPPQNCRTITVERDDGTVRRIRRCD